MVKRLNELPRVQLLSSRNVPPGLGASKGYNQNGAYQEKLPELLQVRTKTVIFRRCARLKKNNIITLLSKENIFPVFKSNWAQKNMILHKSFK